MKFSLVNYLRVLLLLTGAVNFVALIIGILLGIASGFGILLLPFLLVVFLIHYNLWSKFSVGDKSIHKYLVIIIILAIVLVVGEIFVIATYNPSAFLSLTWFALIIGSIGIAPGGILLLAIWMSSWIGINLSSASLVVNLIILLTFIMYLGLLETHIKTYYRQAL